MVKLIFKLAELMKIVTSARFCCKTSGMALPTIYYKNYERIIMNLKA